MEKQDTSKRKKHVKMYMEIPTGSRSENWIKKIAAAKILTPIALEKRERRRKRRLRREMLKLASQSLALRSRDSKTQREVRNNVHELRSRGQESRRRRNEKRRKITTDERKHLFVIEKPATKRERRVRRQIPEKRLVIGARIEHKRKEKEAVLGFSFAWMLFFLLGLNGSKEKSIQKHFDVSIHRSEKPQTAWSPPWVLLTIIYYLAMIREGGSPKPTNTKKKKKKTKKIEVVLYTYGS